MSTQPFLPLFFGDLLAATPTWEGEERALYVLLLAYQWTAGPLPTDTKRIAKMCQYDTKTFTKLWNVVGRKFVDGDGGLVNVRLEEHRERSKQISGVRSDLGRAGGIASGEARRQAKSKQLLQEIGSKGEAIGSDLLQQNRSIHPIPSQSEEKDSEKDSRRDEASPVGTLKTQIYRLSKQLDIASGVITNELKTHSETQVWQALGATVAAKPAEHLPYFRSCLKDGSEARFKSA